MRELIFYTYIVTNFRMGTLYTGHTDDIGRRMEEHIQGVSDGFSKKYSCHHLVWFEEHGSREEAFLRERQIKEWKRDWKVNLIERDNPLWLDIYQCPFWPVPNEEDYPELYAQCLRTALPRKISGPRPSPG